MMRWRAPWADLRRIETRVLLTMVAVAGALAGFASLTDEVAEGGTGRIDRLVLLAFRVPGHPDIAIGPRWVQEAARDVTALGGFTVLTLVSLLATAMLLIHGRRRQALVFAATVAIAQAASEVLKAWIDRPRPTLVEHLDLVYSSSFPSGHAMMTPAVYLTLAGILAAGERRRSEKLLLLGGAALLTVAVGVSRIYLGVHWPTDVLGGWTLGAAIALAASLVLHRTASPRDPA
jgi:undecaprenyl-diphosphatase